MNADGSGAMQFPGIPQMGAGPAQPSWSPDGTKLAFATGGEIWVVNADGSDPHPVTANSSIDSDPAWSSDGTKIVFAKGGSGISVINTDGTNETPLTTTGGTQPAWSPDGTKILFYLNGINMMFADGGNVLRIVSNTTSPPPTCCDYFYENPAWQPYPQTGGGVSITGRIMNGVLPAVGVVINLSGTAVGWTVTDAVGNFEFSGLPEGGNYEISPSRQKYLFTPPRRSFTNLTSNVFGANFEVLGVCNSGRCVKSGKIAYIRSGDVWTMNPDGTNQTNITNHPLVDSGPNYSPDGAFIAFDSNRDSGFGEIYRMNADGSNTIRITNVAGGNTAPFYSPDGRFIVFVSNRDGNLEIYKMNADGSSQVRLTNDLSSDVQPAFSPDGNKIVFISNRGITNGNRVWSMNADGSNQQPFPGTQGYTQRPTFSPDGARIIYTWGPDAVDQRNWTMNADGGGWTMFPAGRNSAVFSPDYLKVSVFCCFNVGPFALEGIWIGDANGTNSGPAAVNHGEQVSTWQRTTAPRTAFDFDGDGRSDHAIFRPSTTDWWHLSSIDNVQRAAAWGEATDVLAPADYDGDLKTDHAVWRPSTGNFHILNSFDYTVRIENFGLNGDIPTGGDWDGDAKADPAVYRPGGAQGVFYYRGSMANPQGNITVIAWGVAGDKAVVGDYDGDSRTDAAIYRPSTGTWYVNRSIDGQLHAINFGLAADVPVPADYDSDGKTDFAVYRDGIWYLLKSAQGFSAFQWGLAGDTPVPADYDGDGRADPGIFRNGVWWILKSTSGPEAVQFGFGTDKPIQAAFVR
jgi:Tol biopolymer transport system component